MGGFPGIVGLGLQTTIGLDLPTTVAATRAGLTSHVLSDTLLGFKRGEHLRVAQLPALAKGMLASERMRTMGIAAAQEALQPLLKVLPPESGAEIPMFLSLPPERPGFPTRAGRQLAEQIAAALPYRTRPGANVGMTTGYEGGLALLDYAARRIRAGGLDICLLGGVESYLDVDTLHWLEAQDRLKMDEQPNGFIPGEAAAFVLLCSSQRAAALGLFAPIEVVSTGRGHEERLWFTGQPNVGTGLTQTFQTVFGSPACPRQQIRATYCDLNGESWRADEWGYAYVRTGEWHASPLQMNHPAAFWGDIGAASGPALVSLAAVELARYLDPQDLVLVWTASDMQPYRSACVLRRVER